MLILNALINESTNYPGYELENPETYGRLRELVDKPTV